MNGDGPLTAWRTNDTANRQGITEDFCVQNHLAYWDALRAMNPGLRIDSCASGGRRNDLETMRRAVPLTRSDFEFAHMPNVVDDNQCQTYGASSWPPLQGLEPGKTYEVEDFDKAEKLSFSGKDLRKTGFTVTLLPRGSAVFRYKLLKSCGQEEEMNRGTLRHRAGRCGAVGGGSAFHAFPRALPEQYRQHGCPSLHTTPRN